MNQFFAAEIVDNVARLSEDEYQHLRVLRMQEGDTLILVDGRGKQYEATLTKLHKKSSEAQIERVVKERSDRPLFDIAIAPTKSNDRIEWFIEKATEVGIGHIYPFISFHSERKVIKPERWQKIARSAMKQSLRFWQPEIHPLQSVETLFQSALPHSDLFIAHLKTNQHHLKDVIRTSQRTLVVIGPEGGFSDKEIELAEQHGFQSVTLGPVRYRTETAGVVATTVFNVSL